MNPPAMKLLLRLYWIKRKEWEREKRKKKDRRVDKGKSWLVSSIIDFCGECSINIFVIQAFVLQFLPYRRIKEC